MKLDGNHYSGEKDEVTKNLFKILCGIMNLRLMQRGLNPLDDKIFMWSTSSTSERKSVSESLFSGSILLFSTGVAIVGGRLRTSMSKKLRKRWEIIERHWIEKTFQGFLILHGKTKTNVCQSVTRVLVKRGI